VWHLQGRGDWEVERGEQLQACTGQVHLLLIAWGILSARPLTPSVKGLLLLQLMARPRPHPHPV
jgi:hypothetical protein